MFTPEHVTLLIPRLAELSQQEFSTVRTSLPACPALSRLLGLATKSTAKNSVSLEEQLCNLFGWQPEERIDCPVAALEVAVELGQEYDPGAWYMKANPVHLLADRDHLILLHAVQLTPEESNEITEDLNKLYQNEPWEFCVGKSGYWYIKSACHYDLKTVSLAQTSGKSIATNMPTGVDSAYWRSILTEIQMLLHTHSINEQRQSRSQLIVNSVWLWGSGKVPNQKLEANWFHCSGDLPLLAGLAASASRPVSPSAYSLQQWQEQWRPLITDDTQSVKLLLLLDQLPHANGGNFSDWCSELQRYDKDWFEPMLEAVCCGDIHGLDLLGAKSMRFDLQWSRLLRFKSKWKSFRMWYEYFFD